MNEIDLVWMSALILVPFVTGFICLCLGNRWGEWTYWVSGLGGALTLGLALGTVSLFKFDTVEQFGVLDDESARAQTSLLERGKASELSPASNIQSSFDWIGKIRWLPRLGIDFHLGLDGSSLVLILLVTLIFFISLLSTWNVAGNQGGIGALLLFGESLILGALLSLNWALWLVFFSGACLVFYLLVKFWAKENKTIIQKKFLQSAFAAGVLFAALAFYCKQIDISQVANPGEMAGAKSQIRRTHPEWNDNQIQNYLSWNTFNLLALQRGGIDALASGNNEDQYSLASPFVQLGGFITVLLAGVLLSGFAPFFNWQKPLLKGSVLSINLPMIGSFSILVLSVLLKFGVNLFPAGLLNSANLIFVISLAGMLFFSLLIYFTANKFEIISWLLPWGWTTFLVGFSSSFLVEPNSLTSKIFVGSIFWFVSLLAAVVGLILSSHFIRGRICVDNLDLPAGLGHNSKGLISVFGLFSLGICGLPIIGGFIGLTMFVPGVFQSGMIPGLILLGSMAMVFLGLCKFAWLLSESKQEQYKLPKLKPSEYALFAPLLLFLVLIGVFPNLVLSWMQPSVAAVSEMLHFQDKR